MVNCPRPCLCVLEDAQTFEQDHDDRLDSLASAYRNKRSCIARLNPNAAQRLFVTEMAQSHLHPGNMHADGRPISMLAFPAQQNTVSLAPLAVQMPAHAGRQTFSMSHLSLIIECARQSEIQATSSAAAVLTARDQSGLVHSLVQPFYVDYPGRRPDKTQRWAEWFDSVKTLLESEGFGHTWYRDLSV